MTEEEVTVSEILLELHKLFSSAAAESPATRLLPRWGKKRKRSVPIVPIEDERRSPATPLAFSPSEDTNPFSFPQPPKKIFRKMAHHKKWVDEQNGRIDSLSSARADLQRSVEEARCRYRMLAEKNCWLKHHLEQQKMNHELVRQRHHQQQQQQQRRVLDLFQVGPTNHQQQQQQRWQVRQQRLLLSAQARKRRKDLQRAKSSSISSASAANEKVPLAILSRRIKTTRDSMAPRHFVSRKFSSPHT